MIHPDVASGESDGSSNGDVDPEPVSGPNIGGKERFRELASPTSRRSARDGEGTHDWGSMPNAVGRAVISSSIEVAMFGRKMKPVVKGQEARSLDFERVPSARFPLPPHPHPLNRHGLGSHIDWSDRHRSR
jgi:hypothetical protein